MIRLRRRSVRVPADWATKVEAALPDAREFRKQAAAFERLAEQGKKRAAGFAAYAPHALRFDKKKNAHEFPPVWAKHPEVKKAIIAMSVGYCAYCQAPVAASHKGKVPGQVEHFKPKSRFPTLAYDVRNYFLSCEACNEAKGSKWPRGGYVRPDRGKPEARFVFHVDGGVEGKKGDAIAKRTVKDLGLGRQGLVDLRCALIKQMVARIEDYWRFETYLPASLRRRGPPLVDAFSPVSAAINQNARRAWGAARGRASP